MGGMAARGLVTVMVGVFMAVVVGWERGERGE